MDFLVFLLIGSLLCLVLLRHSARTARRRAEEERLYQARLLETENAYIQQVMRAYRKVKV